MEVFIFFSFAFPQRGSLRNCSGVAFFFIVSPLFPSPMPKGLILRRRPLVSAASRPTFFRCDVPRSGCHKAPSATFFFRDPVQVLHFTGNFCLILRPPHFLFFLPDGYEPTLEYLPVLIRISLRSLFFSTRILCLVSQCRWRQVRRAGLLWSPLRRMEWPPRRLSDCESRL